MLTSPKVAKRLTGALAACALLATAACGSGASGDDEDTVTLRFSYFTSESNPSGQTVNAWMDEITERSDGKIKFEKFWDATLLASDAVVDGLNDGRADVALVTPLFYPGKFPLTAVAEMPFGSNNMGAIAAAVSELAEENEDFGAEWSDKGLKTLGWTVGGSSAIVSTKKLEKAEDFKGLKIRGIDRGTGSLKASGANVMAIGPNEIYSSLERGLLDATAGIQFGVIPSLKLQEVGDYVVDAGTGAQTASAVAMSESGWKKLSPEHRKIIEEVSAKIPAIYAEKNFEGEDEACKLIKDADVEISQLDDAEVEKLRAAGQDGVVNSWLGEVKKAGLDGEAFRKEYLAAVEEAAAKPEYAEGNESGVARCLSSE